jgi:hypothetical protein
MAKILACMLFTVMYIEAYANDSVRRVDVSRNRLGSMGHPSRTSVHSI